MPAYTVSPTTHEGSRRVCSWRGELGVSPVDPQLAAARLDGRLPYTPCVSSRRAVLSSLCALVVLAACSGGGASSSSTSGPSTSAVTTTTRPDDGALVLGVITPTGGSAAELGLSQRDAVQLAVAEINADGGVLGQPVRTVIRDEGDNPATAELAVQDLVQAGVDAIIGPSSSLDTLGTLATAVSAGVVTCSPTASALALDDFPDAGLFVRTVPSDSLQAVAMARVVEETGSAKAMVVYLDDAYGRPFAQAVEASMRAEGTAVSAAIGFTGDAASFSDAVDAVMANKPDTVVVVADSVTGPAIISAIDGDAVGPKPTYVVNDAIRRPASQTAPFSSSLAARITGVSPIAYPTQPAFVKALHGVDPDATGLYSQNAYDCVNLIALAAQASGVTHGSALAAAVSPASRSGSSCGSFPECNSELTAGRNIDYDGPGGVLALDANGDVSTAVFERFGFDSSGRDVRTGDITVDSG